MKTKEFKNKILERGFYFDMVDDRTYIYSDFKLNILVAIVDAEACFSADLDYRGFDDLEHERKEELFNLIVEYARTPIEEREEPKKYYLKHKWFTTKGCVYLNFCISGNSYDLQSHRSTEDFKTQFTQAEIEKIKEKFNTDLKDFEIVEVQE